MAPCYRRGLALDLIACTLVTSMITVSNCVVELLIVSPLRLGKEHLNIGHARALWWLFITTWGVIFAKKGFSRVP